MNSGSESGPEALRTPAGPSPAAGGNPGPAADDATPTDGRPRAIGYVRVSTREQAENGGSLDAQRATLEHEASRRGWHLRIIEDAGASGKDLKRPGLALALRLLEVGNADVLVAAKLDRLSRSVLDFANLVERSRRQGWGLVALDVGADTSTPQGEMLVNVMVAFAQYERRLIGQRTRDGLAVKKAQGVRLGRPPALPAWVRSRIMRERADGLSFRRIADRLNADGVPTGHGGRAWHASTVRAITLSDESQR